MSLPKELNHSCKNTCSGWQAGWDACFEHLLKSRTDKDGTRFLPWLELLLVARDARIAELEKDLEYMKRNKSRSKLMLRVEELEDQIEEMRSCAR